MKIALELISLGGKLFRHIEKDDRNDKEIVVGEFGDIPLQAYQHGKEPGLQSLHVMNLDILHPMDDTIMPYALLSRFNVVVRQMVRPGQHTRCKAGCSRACGCRKAGLKCSNICTNCHSSCTNMPEPTTTGEDDDDEEEEEEEEEEVEKEDEYEQHIVNEDDTEPSVEEVLRRTFPNQKERVEPPVRNDSFSFESNNSSDHEISNNTNNEIQSDNSDSLENSFQSIEDDQTVEPTSTSSGCNQMPSTSASRTEPMPAAKDKRPQEEEVASQVAPDLGRPKRAVIMPKYLSSYETNFLVQIK
ncbi:unnamed protein product [Ceutorhynchus assimilis]|uniref:Tesmin/TSO1-like CXC domain-containing protein n=1 Tax=Ceutorhynchus assimilis TaxID=467358 RepID=A0A9N9QCL9_9CUCU|nr:unnamed protein product [Ceutorhynchus assimilis]